jgi:hypothetical protein
MVRHREENKMVKTTKDPAIAWAERLWERLQSNFLDAHKTIIEIIGARAWEPLGYDSFATAWQDQMKNITLASEIRPHIVFQMIDEGLTADEIAGIVKGVGPDAAEHLKRQKDNGVPADHATTKRSTRHSPYATVFLKIPREWKAQALARGDKLDEIAYAAIEAWFDDLR